MTEGRCTMAWSSLSSNEIPTKSEVQEALNSSRLNAWHPLHISSDENGTLKQIILSKYQYSRYFVVIGGMRIAPISLITYKGLTLKFWTVGNGTGYGCFSLACTTSSLSLSHLHDSNFYPTLGIQFVFGQ